MSLRGAQRRSNLPDGFVGWVERSETHHRVAVPLMVGYAALTHPTDPRERRRPFLTAQIGAYLNHSGGGPAPSCRCGETRRSSAPSNAHSRRLTLSVHEAWRGSTERSNAIATPGITASRTAC